MSKIKKIVLNERGQVVIIFALLLVCLFGMIALVVDVGSIYEERRHTQTVADAAALAGAQDLPEYPGQAVQTAITYANLNGVVISGDNIQIPEDYTYVPNDTIIVTPTDINASLFFARVLGVNSVTVNATATAIAAGPDSMNNLMPWTVPLEDYPGGLVAGQPYNLKVGPHFHESPGFFQIMEFEDCTTHGGAQQYENNIINGCCEEIWIDEWYPIESGNKAGKTASGLETRLGSDSCTFDDVVGINSDGEYYVKDGDCPRVVYVPMIEARPENPSEPVLIVNFSVFFIESFELQGHGGNAVTEVIGRFVDKTIAVSSGEITGYSGGIKVIRLVE